MGWFTPAEQTPPASMSPAEKQRRATQPRTMVPPSKTSNPTTFGKLMDPTKKRRGGFGQSNEANREVLEAAGML